MWPVNPYDLENAMRVAAERYAFHAALVSIPLILAAIAVFLFARQDLRRASFAGAVLCLHPVWTVTQAWYDNGALLRLASTLWLVFAGLIMAVAMGSLYRNGIKNRKRLSWRFTSRFLMLVTTIVAIVLGLTQPPMSEIVPESRSLPVFGVMLMMVLAFCSSERRRHRPLPLQVSILAPLDANPGDRNH